MEEVVDMAEMPCGKPVALCVEAGSHNPPCACVGPPGHDGRCSEDASRFLPARPPRRASTLATEEAVLVTGDWFNERISSGRWMGCDIHISDERVAARNAYADALLNDVARTLRELEGPIKETV